jgi:hypothetical protein
MEEEVKEHRSKIAKVINRAGSDESFRQRFLAEPKAVLEEYGITLPKGLEVEVVEQTDKVTYVVLPFKAEDAEGGSWMCGDDGYDLPCVRCR